MGDFLNQLFSPQNLVAAIAAAYLLVQWLVKQVVLSKREDQQFNQSERAKDAATYRLYSEQLTETTTEILKDDQEYMRGLIDRKIDRLSDRLGQVEANQSIQNHEISNQRTILNQIWREVAEIRKRLDEEGTGTTGEIS